MIRKIKKTAGFLTHAFTCFCIATMIAQLIGLGMLFMRGALTVDRRAQFFAVLLDLAPKLEEVEQNKTREDAKTTVENRAKASAALLSRKEAIKGGLDRIGGFQTGLKSDRNHCEQLRVEFGILLSQLQTQVRTAALLEVQRTLETLKPKVAKTQIRRMIDDGAMDDVVTIIKAMPLDKRRKILREFRTAAEAQQLHELLIEIRKTEKPPGQQS